MKQTVFCTLAALLLAGPIAASAQTITPIGNSNSHYPNGVAADTSGNVFAVDQFNNIVTEIPAAGGHTTSVALGSGLVAPMATVSDSHGNLFILSYNANGSGYSVIEVMAAGGYGSSKLLGSAFNAVGGLALDAADNLFLTADGAVNEFPATGDYATMQTVQSVDGVGPITLDQNGNIFVIAGLGGQLEELPAAEGYATVKLLAKTSLSKPSGIAVDGSGNIFYADAASGVTERLAAGNYAQSVALDSTISHPMGLAVDGSGNVLTMNDNDLIVILAAGGYTTAQNVTGGFATAVGLALDAGGNVLVDDSGTLTVTELTAASGFIDATPLVIGLTAPTGVALDAEGNLFVIDKAPLARLSIKEIPAASGYSIIKPVVTGVTSPYGGLAVDGSGNLFVPRGGQIEEILAAGGYTTTVPIGPTFSGPGQFAVDADGNVFVPDAQGHTVTELVAAGGYTTQQTLPGSFVTPDAVALDAAGNLFVSDTQNMTIQELSSASGYASTTLVAEQLPAPFNLATDGKGNFFWVTITFTANLIEAMSAQPPVLVAAVLPGGRSVEIGTTATVFATVINTGPTDLAGCQIGLDPPGGTHGLTLDYQTTDPATNAPTGTPDTPVAIAGNNGTQSFLLSFHGPEQTAYTGTTIPLLFVCADDAGTTQAAVSPGLDTIDLTFSATPTPDIIALAATATNDGVANLPEGGLGAFAVATDNAGAAAPITVSADTGAASLPLALTLCQTDPSSGQCLAAPTASVAVDYAAGATPTFSVFLQSTGPVAFAPATARVFVRFTDSGGQTHGSTSVAVRTN